jgi:hypothetical protein
VSEIKEKWLRRRKRLSILRHLPRGCEQLRQHVEWMLTPKHIRALTSNRFRNAVLADKVPKEFWPKSPESHGKWHKMK